ncbi:hypothetical protein BJ684DRAFT_21780 [Piptocephalis cylindrospora]|uniref:Secreted protein n=1 Tax=Piptocephalis cylindrospora TaxID=1907219 RepID=A0A4P9XYX3_9FUNG|nr:hypothetical protein BJ684DRAFT_21780 [Piptocephalis cylindrospora]|eukprot:RKP11645.1 hypothetical protein BJ684DRAFT_21780 [Piptocephalis cylindrospora]
MKLTSILLVSAMLVMALTVAATPTPKDEDSKSDEADKSSDIAKSENMESGENDSDLEDKKAPAKDIATPEQIKAWKSSSKDNTVKGDGKQFCDISNGDRSQCHTGYKCKSYALSKHPTFSGLFGDKSISQDNFKNYVSEDNLGTCVGKLDLNKD